MEATYINHMGDDLAVVDAARVSFNKKSTWEWRQVNNPEAACPGMGKVLSGKDQRLIKYLATHNHWTPFSHVMITMREKVPIFIARQRFKHMVGFTYNEVSRRYVDDVPEFFRPDVWRAAPTDGAKQGSSDALPYSQIEYSAGLDDHHDNCATYYRWLLDEGVAPEQARMVLPQSMYTEYYVTGSLAAWARAYKLRSDPHAQKEIRDLAEQWNNIISNIEGMEHSWKALTSTS